MVVLIITKVQTEHKPIMTVILRCILAMRVVAEPPNKHERVSEHLVTYIALLLNIAVLPNIQTHTRSYC